MDEQITITLDTRKLLRGLFWVSIIFVFSGFVFGWPDDFTLSLLVIYTPLLGLYVFWLSRKRYPFTRLFSNIRGMSMIKRYLAYLLVLMVFVLSFAPFMIYLERLLVPSFVRWVLKALASQPFSLPSNLIAAILAPVVEEVYFRGILLGWLLRKMPTSVAIIVSSLLFAIPHIDLIPLFFVGVVLAIVYIKTRNLWMTILLHAFNNAVAFLVVPFIPIPGLESFTREDSIIAAVLAVISFVILIRFIRKEYPSSDERHAFLSSQIA